MGRPHEYIPGEPIYLPTNLVYGPTFNMTHLARQGVEHPDVGARIGWYSTPRPYQGPGLAVAGTLRELPPEPFSKLVTYAAPVANVQSGDQSAC